MYENYENAYELDCRELHGWEMEQWDLMMEEGEMDRAQEAAYDDWQELMTEIWEVNGMKCDKHIIYCDDIDYENLTFNGTIYRTGHCPYCGKKYRWTETYKFVSTTPFEEVTKE